MATEIVAITGGIGAGKSVVSRVLEALGFDVYDCDSRAKILMDRSSEIKSQIAERIGEEAVVDGVIRRDVLASIVFSDNHKLLILNEIVHRHVRKDIARTARKIEGVLFVETAILYESGLDRMADRVWEVTAPEEVRISRVMKRNGCTYQQAQQRVDSQRTVPDKPHHKIYTVVNDGVSPVLPRLLELVAML